MEAGQRDAPAGSGDIHCNCADCDSQRRDHLKEDQRLQRDASEAAKLAVSGDSRRQRAEDQRRNYHADQAQKYIAQKAGLRGEMRSVYAQLRTHCHGEECPHQQRTPPHRIRKQDNKPCPAHSCSSLSAHMCCRERRACGKEHDARHAELANHRARAPVGLARSNLRWVHVHARAPKRIGSIILCRFAAGTSAWRDFCVRGALRGRQLFVPLGLAAGADGAAADALDSDAAGLFSAGALLSVEADSFAVDSVDELPLEA